MTVGQNLIENSPLAMAVTEGPAHILRSVTPAFCALQGKPAEAMLGHPVSEAISGAGAESVLALLDRVYGEDKNGEDKSGFVNDPQHSPPVSAASIGPTWRGACRS